MFEPHRHGFDEDQPLRQGAPLSSPRGERSTRRWRFVLRRAVLILAILALVVLLAPFIYSIWMLMRPGGLGAF
ncbi:MAG TPA: hypothetical protein VIP78_16500 [Candidatus Dormibacteraeota bacterium]